MPLRNTALKTGIAEITPAPDSGPRYAPFALDPSPALPTWGTMIASSQQFAHQAIWLVVFPGVAIILSALSLQMVGDGFRDLLDPKLRKAM